MSARVVAALKYALLLTPLALLPMASCNTGGGGGGGGSNALTNALIACGVLTPGTFNQFGGEATEPYDNCMVQCFAGGTCDELEAFACFYDLTLYDRCETECLQVHGHMCDGMVLDPFSKCDGFQDCADNSDELGCPPPFMCGDGSQISPDWQCDGEFDCEDGSDEAGCPATMTFACGSGEQVPASWQCDLEPDCADGSDENGCAMLVCPNGGTETFGTLTTTSVSTTAEPDTGFETGETGFDTTETGG